MSDLLKHCFWTLCKIKLLISNMGIRFQEVMFPHFYPRHNYQSFTTTCTLPKWIKLVTKSLSLPSVKEYTLHQTWTTLPLEPKTNFVQGSLTTQVSWKCLFISWAFFLFLIDAMFSCAKIRSITSHWCSTTKGKGIITSSWIWLLEATSPFEILSPNKSLCLKFSGGCNFIGSLDMKAQTKTSNKKQRKWTLATHFARCTLLIQPK